MTDYGPGPCKTCGEDLEIHTTKQLRACNRKGVEVPNMGPTEPRNGRTIVQALLEELWKELDTVVEHIMSESEPDGEDFWTGQDYFDAEPFKEQVKAWGELRGQAQGLAYALAVLINPYQPDIEAIRTEAMERWEAGEEG